MMTAQEMKKLSDEAREKITADKTEKIYQKVEETLKGHPELGYRISW